MAKSMVACKVVFNNLPKLEGRMREKASQVVAKAAHDIEAKAKAVVPVDTGNLKNSIQTDMEPGGLSAEVGTAVEYAPYVEYGTHKRAPKPYLIPAAEAVKPAFEAAMKKLLD